MKTAYQPPIHILRRACLIVLCAKAIRQQPTTWQWLVSIAVIYRATGAGYVSRQRPEMKRRANNFAGLKRGFRTVRLGTSTAVGYGEHTIERKRPVADVARNVADDTMPG